MSGRSTDAFGAWQDYGIDPVRRRVMFHYGMEPADDGHNIGVEHVIRNLMWLDRTADADNGKRIELWINCPGGDVYEMMGLYDVLRSLKSPVDTVAFGCVASAGCLILASGTGTRWATPNTWFMWHQGSTGVDNWMPHGDSQDRAAHEQLMFERWTAEMGRLTKKRKAYWQTQAKGELWLDAKGMLAHGIIDEIWDPSD